MKEQAVIQALIEKKLTLSTAESCTGGMLGSMLTSVGGASEVYGFGFITYANSAKEKLLGVSRATLEAYGAVSEQTAREMALGALGESGSDISVSITGIAGPGGGTKEKPVGLVYTAIATKKDVKVKKLLLKGSREEVRKQTCESVLDDVIDCIKNF